MSATSLYPNLLSQRKYCFSYSWKLASLIEHTTFLNVHFLRSSGCVLFKESEHYFSVKDIESYPVGHLQIQLYPYSVQWIDYTVFDSTVRTISNQQLFVMFLLNVFRSTKSLSDKSSKFCQRCPHL